MLWIHLGNVFLCIIKSSNARVRMSPADTDRLVPVEQDW